jgi:hypothetical protein
MDATRRVLSGVRILLVGTAGVVVAVPLAVLLATAFYVRVLVAGAWTLGRALRR